MPASPSIETLIDEVIDREGDYVHHPADRGGPTRWGITAAVARAQGYDGDMRQLPRDTAADIYARIYWHAPRFDKIAQRAPRIAAELFDTGVNMGTATATGFLQRALNALNRSARDYPDIVVDRAIGHHLGLAELLAGDAARAGCDLEPGEFGRFMRLDMRAVGDALGIAHRLEAGDIGLHPIEIDDDGRRAIGAGDLGLQGLLGGSGHGSTLMIASISTGMLPGSEPMPTAERA